MQYDPEKSLLNFWNCYSWPFTS